MKLYGTTTVGPKGQIVIPKDVRNILDIETGDNLVVLMKDGKYIGLVKNDNMGDLMKYMSSEGVKISGE